MRSLFKRSVRVYYYSNKVYFVVFSWKFLNYRQCKLTRFGIMWSWWIMLRCTSKLPHRVTQRHLETCFFIVSWNFPVAQLWEQVKLMQCSGVSVLLWLWVMTWVLLRACELIRRIFLSTHRADPLTLETDLNAAANRMNFLVGQNGFSSNRR